MRPQPHTSTCLGPLGALLQQNKAVTWGGSGSTVKLRRSPGESCGRGADCWQVGPEAEGSPLSWEPEWRRIECTQCGWLSTGTLTYRTNHFSVAFSSHRSLRYLVFSGDHLLLGFTITKVRVSQQRPLQVQITVRQAKKNLVDVDGSWDSTPFLSCQSKGKEPSFTGDSHRRRSLGPTLIA